MKTHESITTGYHAARSGAKNSLKSKALLSRNARENDPDIKAALALPAFVSDGAKTGRYQVNPTKAECSGKTPPPPPTKK